MTGKRTFVLAAFAALAVLACTWASAEAYPRILVRGPYPYPSYYRYHYRHYGVVVPPRAVLVGPAPVYVIPRLAPVYVTSPPVVTVPAPVFVQPAPFQGAPGIPAPTLAPGP